MSADDVVGVCEHGTQNSPDLIVVGHETIFMTGERGLFKKQIETRRLGDVRNVAELRTEDGYKGREVYLIGNSASGEETLRITWGGGGPEWVVPMIERQRTRLGETIREAIGMPTQ
jgi:hypothetical protein